MNAPVIATAAGSSATIERDRILVRDAHGRMVVAYSETEGLSLCAPDGDLKLSAPNGRVIIEGREATVEVGRWEVKARRIVESAADVYRNITGLAQMRAGRLRCVVDKGYELFAQRSLLSTKDDTSIEAKRVLLG